MVGKASPHGAPGAPEPLHSPPQRSVASAIAHQSPAAGPPSISQEDPPAQPGVIGDPQATPTAPQVQAPPPEDRCGSPMPPGSIFYQGCFAERNFRQIRGGVGFGPIPVQRTAGFGSFKPKVSGFFGGKTAGLAHHKGFFASGPQRLPITFSQTPGGPLLAHTSTLPPAADFTPKTAALHPGRANLGSGFKFCQGCPDLGAV